MCSSSCATSLKSQVKDNKGQIFEANLCRGLSVSNTAASDSYEVFVNRNAEEEEGWEARNVGDELKAASRHPDTVNHYHHKAQS